MLDLIFDLLFNITEWLRETALLDYAFWLMETPLSLLMVENFWMVPIVQVIHIICIAVAFAALLMFVMRVRGKAGMSLSVADNASRYIPWIWWGLLGIVLSGILMATAEPLRNMINAVFWIKMITIVLVCLITIGWQKSVKAKALAAGAGYEASTGAKSTGIFLLVVWCFIMLCGRWIAYVPV